MTAAPATLSVRPMQHAERAAALDLWVASWQAAYPSIDFGARRGWMEQRFDELERRGALVQVAIEGGRIVGFVTIDPATGYLDQLVVSRTHQRKGVAGLLIGEAQRLSPRRIDLHVNQDNTRAIAFYRKFGFTESGAHDFMLGRDRQTDIIMTRPLTAAAG